MGTTDIVLPEKESNIKVVDDAFMKKVLKPYYEHTTYLKKAIFEIQEENKLLIKGVFEIGDSCYIEDTGHFNAVEFNICYNQLAYVFMGYCIKNGLLEELKDFASDDDSVFFEKQLSHFLITNITSSYRSQVNAKHFYGEIGVKSISKRSKCTFVNMYCNFKDDDNGVSKGEVSLAILHP